MKCLICNLKFIDDEKLRSDYIWQHLINENNEYFEDFLLADNNLKRCEKCMMRFENCGLRKKPMFLLHYN